MTLCLHALALLHLISHSKLSASDPIDLCQSSECYCELNTETVAFPTTNIDCTFTRGFPLNSTFILPDNVNLLDLSRIGYSVLTKSQLFSLGSLKKLYLSRNRVKIIENNAFDLPALTHLDLSFNELQAIDDTIFGNLKQLKYLNLASNKFTYFTSGNFRNLRFLDDVILDDNPLGHYLETNSMFLDNGMGLHDGISALSLGNVGLSYIPENFVAEAYNLRKLRLSRNNITLIPELPYTLEILDLSHTDIAEISSEDFSELPALKELYLNDILIGSIEDYVFADLKALTKLELEGNRRLTEFSELAFGQGIIDDPDEFSLQELSLRGCSLRTLSEELAEPFARLSLLDLQGNLWTCDCNILWITKLQLGPEDYNHIRCVLPPALHGSKLFDVKARIVCLTSWQRYHTFLATVAVVLCALLGCAGAYLVCYMPARTAPPAPRPVLSSASPYHLVTIKPISAQDSNDR